VAEVTGKKLGDPKIPNKEIPNSKILRNPRFGIWDLAIGILYGFPTLEFGISHFGISLLQISNFTPTYASFTCFNH
jgi:hypothetical protein